MIPNLDNILKEWSYRVGVIDYKNNTHLYHLNKILNERGWPQNIINEFVGNINELAFDMKGVQKYYKNNSREIFKYGNDWVKRYIQQFKRQDLDASVIQKGSNAPQIKKGNPNRIEFVLQINNIGRDSRDLAFDAAKLFKGDFSTKFTPSRIQSSAGSVVHKPKKYKDLEIWIAFKGGKS